MKTRYILSCLLLGGALSVSAQKMAVKSNLLSAANGALNAGVEYAFGLQIHIRFVRQHTSVETLGRICQQILAHTT